MQLFDRVKRVSFLVQSILLTRLPAVSAFMVCLWPLRVEGTEDIGSREYQPA